MPITRIQSGITLNSAKRTVNKFNGIKSRINIPKNLKTAKTPKLKDMGHPLPDSGSSEPIGKTMVGAGAGAAAGAVVGAIVGSVVPVAGTAIGAELGAWFGAGIGGMIGALQKKDFGEE